MGRENPKYLASSALRATVALIQLQSYGPVDSNSCRYWDNSLMHVRLPRLAGHPAQYLHLSSSIAIAGALITGTYALAKRRGQVVAGIYAASAALNCGIAGATFFSTLIVYFSSKPQLHAL